MANSEASYVKVDMGDDDSQRMTKSRVISIGGPCLALLSIIAISTFTFMVPRTSVAENTSLVGLPSSLRYAKKPSHMVPSLASLPGGHWKNLALAGIEASNRCDKGASAKTWFSNMDRPSRDVLVKAYYEFKKMEDIKVGQLPPMGFWDPAGFSTDLEPGKILFYREAELKHGRVCMLASLGFLVGENFHPLFGGDIDVPSYIAFQETPLQAFWVAVLLLIGIPEFQYSVPTFVEPTNATFSIVPDRIPGDLGFDPLNLKPKDEKELEMMQNKELNNGRLAMIATAGMVVQELVSGEKLLDTVQKLR